MLVVSYPIELNPYRLEAHKMKNTKLVLVVCLLALSRAALRAEETGKEMTWAAGAAMQEADAVKSKISGDIYEARLPIERNGGFYTAVVNVKISKDLPRMSQVTKITPQETYTTLVDILGPKIFFCTNEIKAAIGTVAVALTNNNRTNDSKTITQPLFLWVRKNKQTEKDGPCDVEDFSNKDIQVNYPAADGVNASYTTPNYFLDFGQLRLEIPSLSYFFSTGMNKIRLARSGEGYALEHFSMDDLNGKELRWFLLDNCRDGSACSGWIPLVRR